MLKGSEVDFQVSVPAKWVLAGEHSVLRGARALAFPYSRFSLSLTYQSAQNEMGARAPELIKLLSLAADFLQQDAAFLSDGKIKIQSEIPIGAGLGSSAAVSVAVARFALWKTKSPVSLCIPLATHLENFFHGKSSGMDVSVIAHAQPVLFSMKNAAELLAPFSFAPNFSLVDTGLRGNTKACIEKVNVWRAEHPEAEVLLDQQMAEATETAYQVLSGNLSPPQKEAALIQAMELAQNCYVKWGLVPPELSAQHASILKQGALAAKLTGAGLGGFWVALWPNQSPVA